MGNHRSKNGRCTLGFWMGEKGLFYINIYYRNILYGEIYTCPLLKLSLKLIFIFYLVFVNILIFKKQKSNRAQDRITPIKNNQGTNQAEAITK